MKKFFKKNKKFETVIDIGTNKTICINYQKKKNSGLKILSWNHKKTEGIIRSKIVEPKSVSETINQIFSDFGDLNFENKNIYSNFTDTELMLTKNYNEISMGGLPINKRDIRKIYMKNLKDSLKINRTLLHSMPLNFNVDNKVYSENPLGINCKKLGLSSINFLTNNTLIKDRKELFMQSNLVMDEIIDSGLASAMACLTDSEKKIGITCIDLGAGSSKIVTFFENNIELIHNISIGGNDVTNDICRGLDLPKEISEYIKIVHGSLSHSSNDKIRLDLNSGFNKKIITHDLLNGIIKPRYEEILEIIRDKLEENLISKISLNKIVFTGGASQIQGLLELAFKVFNRDTKLAYPNSHDIEFNKPEFSTIWGLLKIMSDNDLKSIVSSKLRKQKFSLLERLDNWITESVL